MLRLLQFALSTRPNGKPRVSPYGFSYEKIDYALVIDRQGHLVDVSLIDGELDVPSDPTTTRTSGVEPMFLWNKTANVLGLAPEPKKRTSGEHAAFKKRFNDVVGVTNDASLNAVRVFLQTWELDIARLPRFREELTGTVMAVAAIAAR